MSFEHIADSASATTPETSSQLAALIPHRLGSARKLPDWPVELHFAMQMALVWQEHGVFAALYESHTTCLWKTHAFQPGRAYEIVGCLAGVGEQLGLACTAAREYLGWVECPDDSHPIAVEMAMRAVTELQTYYLVAVGHALFNLVGRATAMDFECHPGLMSGLNTTYVPDFADGYLPTANLAMVGKLEKVAERSESEAIRKVVGPIAALIRSPEWRQLNRSRAEGAHRWRGQSAGIIGVPKQTPWEFRSTGVRSLRLGSGVLGVDVPVKRAADAFTIATAARSRILSAMQGLDNLILSVFGDLPDDQ